MIDRKGQVWDMWNSTWLITQSTAATSGGMTFHVGLDLVIGVIFEMMPESHSHTWESRGYAYVRHES